MARNPKVHAAYRAMADLGIGESQVKPVLKNLLKLYEKNWELIEQENYRALADAIFEADENKVPELKKVPEQKKRNKKVHEEEMEDEEAQMNVEPARPLKRIRLRGQENSPSSAASPLKQPKNTAPVSDGNARIEACPVPAQDAIVDKGKKPVSPQAAPRGRFISESERASPSATSRDRAVKLGMPLLPSNKMPCNHALIVPKDEPTDELPDYQVPIAVIPPGIQWTFPW